MLQVIVSRSTKHYMSDSQLRDCKCISVPALISGIAFLASLIPRPYPAFRRLQNSTASDGKLGGAWEWGYILP